jgi:hypothetical protein
VAAIVRYRQIKDLPVLQEVPISQEQTPSFAIKHKLSTLLSSLFVCSAILTLVAPKELYFGSAHKYGAIVYLLGAVAWYLSRWLLEREYER